MQSNDKVAIVYDWFDTKGGGVERLLVILHAMYPHADFFTSFINHDKALWSKEFKVHTSFMQSLPSFIKKSRILSLPFFSFAFESFNFRKYKVVISVSSSFAKGIITPPGTQHICYLLTPTRYLWIMPEIYGVDKKSFLMRPFVNYFSQWDKVASSRPDILVSISETVARRCKTYYNRDSKIVFPPFDRDYWIDTKNSLNNYVSPIKIDKPYYLVVSRLEKYKNVDLVVRAFKNQTEKKLIIVGEGTQEQKLRELASGSTSIRFLKQIDDRNLAYLYQNAEALIMPQEEDFGYVAVEAQFFGCPVIAYKKGGAQETVEEGKTGIFFEEQTSKSLLTALERFHTISYNVKASARIAGPHAAIQFDKNKFIKQFKHIVEIPK